MLPGPAALVLAALIATAGIALSLAWSRETLACFAILGAIAVPGIADGALEPLGVSFAFVLYLAAAILMVERRWWRLFQASALVLLVEELLVSAGPDDTSVTWPMVLGPAAFVGVAVAAAVLHTLRLRRGAVPREVAALLLAALVVTFAAIRVLYPHEPSGGIALLVAGVGFAAPGFALLRRDRDLASVLAASGLLLGGVGLGEALHGGWRVAAFAFVAIVMSHVGRRLGEGRFALAAAAHLAAVPSAFATLLAAVACTRDVKPAWRHRAGSVSLTAAVYTASLLVLGLLQEWGAGGVLGIVPARRDAGHGALGGDRHRAAVARPRRPLPRRAGSRAAAPRGGGRKALPVLPERRDAVHPLARVPGRRRPALGGGLAYQRLAVTRGSRSGPAAPAGCGA
jgi:Predicted membrane protein (DUF2339)